MSAHLEITAKPSARLARITRSTDGVVVSVRERAVDGRANEAILRAIADWLGVAPSRVHLVRGGSGRRKLVAVEGLEETALRARIAALPK